MDTFVDSSWYFLRFCDPGTPSCRSIPAAACWMPADFCSGGVEHAILHLLYSRFFTRVLRHRVGHLRRAVHAAVDPGWCSTTAPSCRSPRVTWSIRTTWWRNTAPMRCGYA
jgi:leucyl-tRNA synthetase